MVENSVAQCTYGYVVTDEGDRQAVAPDNRRPGSQATCTDNELLTVRIVAELVQRDAETRCLADLPHHHPARVPRRPATA